MHDSLLLTGEGLGMRCLLLCYYIKMDKKYLLARNLRKNSTTQEILLWSLLRNRKLNNLKFKRQVPIGSYIVDFVCEEKKLIIELDGGQHNTPENLQYDKKRTEYLNSLGYKVIRFWNNEFDNNLEGVYEKLLEVVS